MKINSKIIIGFIVMAFAALITQAVGAQDVTEEMPVGEVMQEYVSNTELNDTYTFNAWPENSMFVMIAAHNHEHAPTVNIIDLTTQKTIAMMTDLATGMCVRIAPGTSEYMVHFTDGSATTDEWYGLMVVPAATDTLHCPAEIMSMLERDMAALDTNAALTELGETSGIEIEAGVAYINGDATLSSVTSIINSGNDNGNGGTPNNNGNNGNGNGGNTNNNNGNDDSDSDNGTGISVDVDLNTGLGLDAALDLDLNIGGISLNGSTCLAAPVNGVYARVYALAAADTGLVAVIHADADVRVLGNLNAEAWLMVNVGGMVGFVPKAAVTVSGNCATVPLVSLDNLTITALDGGINLTVDAEIGLGLVDADVEANLELLNNNLLDADADVNVGGNNGISVDADVNVGNGANVDADVNVGGNNGVSVDADVNVGNGVNVDADVNVGGNTGVTVDAGANVGNGGVNVDAGANVGGNTGVNVDAGMDVGNGGVNVDAGVNVGGNTGVGVDAGVTTGNTGNTGITVTTGTPNNGNGLNVGVNIGGTSLNVGVNLP